MVPEKAIVSPCSSCTNKRSESANGRPACPRLQWQAYAQSLPDVPEALSLVLLTGTEGTPQEGTGALVNPVYSDSDHHILVWIATLKDNQGVYSPDGVLTVPPILDPAFDTDFIQCSQLPYSVKDTEASYFMKGAYREGDLVQAYGSDQSQVTSAAGEVTDFDPLRVGGTVEKIDFPFRFNRKHVPKDLTPRGT